jgi:hypothetical protein
MAMYDPRRKKDREEGPSWKRKKKAKAASTSKPTTAAAGRKQIRAERAEKLKTFQSKRKELLVQREKTRKSVIERNRMRNRRRGVG